VLAYGAESDPERVKEILEGLRGKGRWGLNVMLLSKPEKAYGDTAWRLCGEKGDWR